MDPHVAAPPVVALMAATPATQPLSAASTMAAGTLASRASGVARVLVLAWVLGFTPLADAYNLANTIPNMLYDVVLGGIATATFVPVFVERLHRDGERRAWRSISAVVTISTVVLVVASVATFALAPWIIDGFTALNHLGMTRSPQALAQQRDVATTLLRWFSPQILFYGLLSLSAALLNVRGRFGAPAWAPIVNNLVCIGVLCWFGAVDPVPS
ncbi:MAG TPA: lipid II flippase MurJ, partial [Acidimicrobiales bacterium]|nr:lipid II flippase MurJ [Acidimicrobiales bacterium]